MALAPLLDYVMEVSEGGGQVKPGKALAAFMKLNRDEKDEVTRFFSNVSEKGKDVMIDFETNYPILAAEPKIFDVIGQVIDYVMSGDMSDYMSMFKINNG